MAVGVPQVANTGPGMESIIESSHTGKLADALSSVDIGKSIRELLGDAHQLAKIRTNARETHLERFCYEKQFEPVVRQIKQWIEKRAVSPK